jgi:hypothetical protein
MPAPNPGFVFGQIPTAAQWNAAFTACAANDLSNVDPATGQAALGLGTMALQSDAGLDFTTSFEGSGNPGVFYSGQFFWTWLSPTPTTVAISNGIGNFTATGGTPGFTQNTLRVLTTAGSANVNYTWGFLSQMTDHGPSTSQNVSGYLQMTKMGVGSSFASTIEMLDHTTDPAEGSVSLEIDARATSTDSNSNRVGLHQVFSNLNLDNAAYEIATAQKFTIVGTGGVVHKMLDFTSIAQAQCDYLIFSPNFSVTPNGVLNVTGAAVSEGGIDLNRASASPASASRLNLQIDGTTVSYLQADGATQATLSLNGGNGVTLVSAAFQPVADNAVSSGGASNRWSVVYAATGTINTSDETQKTAIAPIGDAELDAIGDVAPRMFQYLDAVAAKGSDGARLHAGAVAQHLRDAFAAHGLDPARYGVFCSDPAMETVEEVFEKTEPLMEEYDRPTVEHVEKDGAAVRRVITVRDTRQVVDLLPVIDQDGRPIVKPARPAAQVEGVDGKIIDIPARPEIPELHPVRRWKTTQETRLIERPSADKVVLGLRYDELSILMHAWSRRELSRLGARVAALEKK